MAASWRLDGPRDASFYRGGVQGPKGLGPLLGDAEEKHPARCSSHSALLQGTPILNLTPQGTILGGVPPGM